jgi:hypothetical protein
MTYRLWYLYFGLLTGKWSPLHRLRLLWLDLQIGLLMLRYPNRILRAIRAARG